MWESMTYLNHPSFLKVLAVNISWNVPAGKSLSLMRQSMDRRRCMEDFPSEDTHQEFNMEPNSDNIQHQSHLLQPNSWFHTSARVNRWSLENVISICCSSSSIGTVNTESSNVLPPNCHISRVFRGISYLGGIYLPLWKMMEWVRQLGWFSIPNWMESHSKFHGSKAPTRYIVIPIINHY